MENSSVDKFRVHSHDEPPDYDFAPIRFNSSADPTGHAYGILRIAEAKLPATIKNDDELSDLLEKIEKRNEVKILNQDAVLLIQKKKKILHVTVMKL